jgi:hypothetical protein
MPNLQEPVPRIMLVQGACTHNFLICVLMSLAVVQHKPFVELSAVPLGNLVAVLSTK